MNLKNTFIDNESSTTKCLTQSKSGNSDAMNNKTEVPLTKKESPIEQHTRYRFEIHFLLRTKHSRSSLHLVESVASQTVD